MTVMTKSDARPLTIEDRRSSLARIPASFRLQFSVPSAMIGVPIMVFGASWIVGTMILVWIRMRIDPVGPVYGPGAAQSTVWALAFIAAYTASHTFPFSLALSYSRRLFTIGAFLAFATVSAGFGLAYTGAALVERVTNGFGLDVYVFDTPMLNDSAGIPGAGVLAAVVALFFMMIGFFWAILYQRVTLAGLWTVIIGLVVVLIAATLLTIQFDGWVHVWNWLTAQTTLTGAGWLFAVTVLLSGVNYALIRRAT